MPEDQSWRSTSASHWNFQLQITNFQSMSNSQIINFKMNKKHFEILILGFENYLDIGIWDLDIPARSAGEAFDLSPGQWRL